MTIDFYFKEIPLYPTKFYLDVWVCCDKDALINDFHDRYGSSVEYYRDEIRLDSVQTVVATEKSKLKGEKRIVMILENFDSSIIVHEIYHVFSHLSEICGLENNNQSQEWVSYFLEYLFLRCIDLNTFIKNNDL